jgi:hypothetical protein
MMTLTLSLSYPANCWQLSFVRLFGKYRRHGEEQGGARIVA